MKSLFAMALLALSPLLAMGQTTRGIALQVYVLKPTGEAANVAQLPVRVQILSPNNCVLVDENHGSIDVIGGFMRIPVGTGVREAGDHGLSLAQALGSTQAQVGLDDVNGSVGSCSYTPQAQDIRKIRVSFQIGADPISADFSIRSSAYAVAADDAQALQGKAASEFLQKNSAKNLTQTKIEDFFNLITSQVGKLIKFDGTNFVAVDPSAINGGQVTWSGLQGKPAAITEIEALSSETCQGKVLQFDGTGHVGCAQAASDWDSLQNKPTTFAPSAHGHYYSDLQNNDGAYLNYKPNNAACADGQVLKFEAASGHWICGTVSGSASDISISPIAGLSSTNVQDALSDLKSYADNNKTTSLDYSAITNKPATFTPSSHTHPASEVNVGGISSALLGPIPPMSAQDLFQYIFNVGATTDYVDQKVASGSASLNASNITSGIVTVGHGGTGSSSIPSNSLIISNSSGTALVGQNCAAGKLLSFDALGVSCVDPYTLPSVGTAGTYVKVTTDAQGRVVSGSSLAASDIPAIDASKITSGNLTLTGDIAAGNIAASKQISGATVNAAANATALDFANGNTVVSQNTCASAIAISNMKDGGTYTFVNTDTTTTTQCSFSASGLTFKFSPANGPRASGTMSSYAFLRVGTIVLVSWGTGFN